MVETGTGSGVQLRYLQVMQLVLATIDEQGLRPGDLLPTNKQLADLAGVSLISVRRALDELERAGRIRRHQGVGTFVAGSRIVTSPSQSGGFRSTLGGSNVGSVTTSVLGVRSGRPNDAVRGALGLDTSDRVWVIRRLRLIDGRPMIIETSFLPQRLTPGLDAALGAGAVSLYSVLAEAYGLRDATEEQQLDVIEPTPEQRDLLELGARSQVVRIRGVTSSETGVAFDCFEQIYPSDGFAFHISGRATGAVLPVAAAEEWSTIG